MTLDRIFSERKRKECEDILASRNPTHNARCFLVGFLKYCGYTETEVFRIIHKLNNWIDYDPEYTRYQINSIFRSSSCSGPSDRIGYSRKSHVNTCIRTDAFIDLHNTDKLNRTFLAGAIRYAIEPASQQFMYPDGKYIPNLPDEPTYRSCEGVDHYLLFIDIENPQKNLSRSWEVCQILANAYKFDIIKFSGSRGFHLIKRLPACFSHMDAKRIALQLCKDTNIPTSEIDTSIYTKYRLVRAFCKNHKSGLYSIPVSVDDKLEDILENAKNPQRILSA